MFTLIPPVIPPTGTEIDEALSSELHEAVTMAPGTHVQRVQVLIKLGNAVMHLRNITLTLVLE